MYVIKVFHKGLYEPPLRSKLAQRGPIASGDGSVPLYLYEPIATCEFRGGGGSWAPVPPLGSALGLGCDL